LGVKIQVSYNYFVETCPKKIHFHVSCVDVMEKQDFNFLYEVSDPNSALAQAIKELPDDWEGSIEVNDHETLPPSQMPLIDFWRNQG